LDEGTIDYYPAFLSKEEADELWELCKYEEGKTNPNVPWSQDMVVVGKRTILEPRFTAFLGDKDGLKYTYSQKLNVSSKWPAKVLEVRKRIENLLADGNVYNVALINWYNDGRHHVGWHSDSETDLLEGSCIVSLSLGDTREFQLRNRRDSELGMQQTEIHKKMNEEGRTQPTPEEAEILKHKVGTDPTMNTSIMLSHGDLVVMGSHLQQRWRHRIPMLAKDAVGPRICFTFRAVADLEAQQHD